MKEDSNPEKGQLSVVEFMKFDLYIDAVGDSAARSRGVIVLLMTATLVAALGMFNSLQAEYNWFSSRIKVLHEMHPWLVFPTDTVKDSLYVKELSTDSAKQKFPNRFNVEELKKMLGDSIDILTLKEPLPFHLQFRIPKQYIKNDAFCLDCLQKDLPDGKIFKIIANAQRINPATRAELDDLLVIYDRTRLENTSLVRMPILGITFDVNWLNFVSSISFSIILFLLYYNLSRERKNLYLVFKIAEKKKIDKLDFYQMLSMRQVLNIPPSVDEFLPPPEPPKNKDRPDGINTSGKNQPDEKELESAETATTETTTTERKQQPKKRDINKTWRSRLAKFPIYAPALIWALILGHDLSTLEIGQSINRFLTCAGLAVSLIFGSFMLFFVYLCIQQWNQIDEIWSNQAEAIRANVAEEIRTDEAKKSSNNKPASTSL